MSKEPGFAFVQDVEKQGFGVLTGAFGVGAAGETFSRACNDTAE
jgi:hypothetical protein